MRDLNTWEGCPQSRLHLEVRSSHRGEAIAMMQVVARAWDELTPSLPVLSWTPWRRRLRRAVDHFSDGGYATVTSLVSTGALTATLEHIGALRHQPRIRRNLAAIAFLEMMETAVDMELQRRSGRPGVAMAIPGSPVAAEEGRRPTPGAVPARTGDADPSSAESGGDGAAS
jgi:hypothetical protein